MKAYLIGFWGLVGLALAASLPSMADEGKLRPFMLVAAPPAAEAGAEAVVAQVRQALAGAGFEVVGAFSPQDGITVLAFTRDDMLATAARTPRGAYGAVLSLSVAERDGVVELAYRDPRYVAAGYRLADDYAAVADDLIAALGEAEGFGAEGISASDLRRYRYAFGMETFADAVALGRFPSHEAAVEQLDRNLGQGRAGIEKVFKVAIPDREQVLYGVSLSPRRQDAEQNYLLRQVDDGGPLRHAFLPYGMLVDGRDVESLHLRFRLALYHPDLRMMGEGPSFFRLRRSPDAVVDVMRQAVDGELPGESPVGGFTTF